MSDLKTALLWLLPIPAVFAGCSIQRTAPIPAADYYYLTGDKDLSKVGRIAVIELENDSSYPQVSADITKSLFHALQKKQIFGLTLFSRKDPAWRSLQLTADAAYTSEQLASIHRTLKCNAVLVGTVTEFKPYPHIAVGLSLRLIDLTDGRLLWGLEQIWDDTDKTTESRIERYFRTQKRPGSVTMGQKLVAVSTLEFIKFVTYETVATISCRR